MNQEYIESRLKDVFDLVLLLLVMAAYEVLANVVFALILLVRIGSFSGMNEFIIRMVGWPPLLLNITAGGLKAALAIVVSYLVALVVVAGAILWDDYR